MISVVRNPTPPASLAKQKSWREDDVLDALHYDFMGKCYLCERPHPRKTIQVDHLILRSEDDSTNYDWNNLFPACGSCNNRRHKKSRPGGYLNPCVDVIEKRLKQSLNRSREIKIDFIPINSLDQPSVNTADQLNHIHNDPLSKDAVELRDAIKDQIIHAYSEYYEYRNKLLNYPTETYIHERNLKEYLSKTAPFTALIRSLFPDLSHLFD